MESVDRMRTGPDSPRRTALLYDLYRDIGSKQELSW